MKKPKSKYDEEKNSSKDEAIIEPENGDARFGIEDHTIYPYCYMGRVWTEIKIKFGRKNKDFVKGTGFVVGARTILTAAHNIDPNRDSENQINPEKTTYSPSFLQSGQTSVCKEIYIPPEYYSGKSDTNEYDWAVLSLSDNIEQKIIKVCDGVPEGPALKEFNDDQIKKLPISVVGFSAESTDGQLREMKGKISELLNPRQLVYKISTSPGQSGGPVYVVHNNLTYFVGIHKAKYEKDGTVEANLGIRITSQIIQKVAEMEGSRPIPNSQSSSDTAKFDAGVPTFNAANFGQTALKTQNYQTPSNQTQLQAKPAILENQKPSPYGNINYGQSSSETAKFGTNRTAGNFGQTTLTLRLGER